MISELRTWSGTYRFAARQVIAARTIDDVRRAVAAGGRVRALGTRHSFNDLADNEATLVTVTGIAPDPVLDEASRTVTVGTTGNQPPTAAYTSSCANLACTFTDQSSDADGTVTAWSWKFGDGTPDSTEANPKHTYEKAGKYRADLSVADAGGDSDTDYIEIEVQ